MRALPLILAARAFRRSEAEVLLVEGMSWAPISSTRLTKARSLADLRSLLAWTWGVGARQGAMGRGGEGVAAAAGGEALTPGGQLSARVCSEGCATLGRSTESLVTLVALPPPPRSAVA